MRLLAMFQRSCEPGLWQFGYPPPAPQVSSSARLLTPATTFFRTLLVMVTSLTTAKSPLCEDLTVSTMAYPICAWAQTFSMILLSKRMRWPLLISKAFFTAIELFVTEAVTHARGLYR